MNSLLHSKLISEIGKVILYLHDSQHRQRSFRFRRCPSEGRVSRDGFINHKSWVSFIKWNQNDKQGLHYFRMTSRLFSGYHWSISSKLIGPAFCSCTLLSEERFAWSSVIHPDFSLSICYLAFNRNFTECLFSPPSRKAPGCIF